MFFCRLSRVNAVFLFVFLLLETDAVHGESNAEILSKIRSAWQERRDAIKSFYSECALEKSETIGVQKVDTFGDEFDPAFPTHEEYFHQTLTFAFDGGKLAYKLEGEEWSQIKNAKAHYLYHVAFDGKGNQTLLHSVTSPWGEINHEPNPHDALTSNIHLKPHWLSIDPRAYLERMGYEPDKMVIVNNEALRRDQRCIEFDIPRTAGLPAHQNPEWTAQLYLGSEQGYLPVAFVGYYKDDLQFEIDIEHGPNDQVGWALSGWTQKQFGDRPFTVDGAVMKLRVNAAIDKAVFDVSFPVGTRIVETVGKEQRNFIKMPDGTLKPFSEKPAPQPGLRPIAPSGT